MRWYVPGDVLRQALAGAETPTLYARFERDGRGVLATVPLPHPPPRVALATAGCAARRSSAAAWRARRRKRRRRRAAERRAARRGDACAGGERRCPAARLAAFARPTASRGCACAWWRREGRVRARLVDGERPAGWHPAPVPRVARSPGTYFAVAEQAGERVVAKVIVLR